MGGKTDTIFKLLLNPCSEFSLSIDQVSLEIRKSGGSGRAGGGSNPAGEEPWSNSPAGNSGHAAHQASASVKKTMYAVYAEGLPGNASPNLITEFFRAMGAESTSVVDTQGNGESRGCL